VSRLRASFFFVLAAALALAACAQRERDGAETTRVISVGGAITEIVVALGAEPRLVGVDTSSVHPAHIKHLPQVGYQRTLSAEGILALRPSLLLLSSEAGPPAVLAQLEAAGVPSRVLRGEPTVAGAEEKIRAVAESLGLPQRGEALVAALHADMKEAQALLARTSSKPRVLFIYARGASTIMVSGKGTTADAMIRLAGGENAVSEFEGFKPITSEAVVAAKPDIILIPTHGLESLGGIEALFRQPGLSLTPAGEAKRVVSMDDLLLLGFGPRTGKAVRELGQKLHPELNERGALR